METAVQRTEPPAPQHVPWTPQLVRVMAGLMASLFLAAIDATVVGTAGPTIARDLGHFELYPWIFTAYLLVGTTTVPLWGRVADLFGRRWVLLVGIGMFVVASPLCMTSRSMVTLIAFRALQGVGAGCIQPVVFTVVGDIFPVRQRARLQGFFSSMWAISAVLGPAVGALLVSTLGWQWIFGINLPIGVLAMALLWGYRERRGTRDTGGLDFRGAALLTAAIVLLLLGAGAGSTHAQPNLALLAVGLVLLAGFVWLELRNPNPTVPLDLLRHRVLGPALVVVTLGGALMFGVTAYVPIYVQNVLGGSPYQAGAAVGLMSLGWPAGSIISGFTLVRVGYARLLVLGTGALLGGAVVLVLGAASGVLWLAAACALIGLGMGFFSSPTLIVIQSSVEWGRRGAATALNQFCRTIGSSVGVALMGVLLQAALTAGPTRGALQHGLSAVFWVQLGLAAATMLTALVILRMREPVLATT
ncbi:MAG TPA: MDR family MFS transporter [Candidatus Dormibacteraeota bacterium]